MHERTRNTRRIAAQKHTRGNGYSMGFISTKRTTSNQTDSRRADHSGVRRHLIEQVLINEALIADMEGN